MPTIIRPQIFEFNSSSCHSITFAPGTAKKWVIPHAEYTIDLGDYSFGWEQDTHYDFGSKLAYILIYYRDWYRGTYPNFRSNLQIVLLEFGGIESFNVGSTDEYSYSEDVEPMNFMEYFNYVDELKAKVERNELKYVSLAGAIDHQSVEDGNLDHVVEDIDELADFLFGNTYITTDNDNH